MSAALIGRELLEGGGTAPESGSYRQRSTELHNDETPQPVPAFEMSQAMFLLQLFVIALDTPAQFGDGNEWKSCRAPHDRDKVGQTGERELRDGRFTQG
jgi:hypothetical protein